MKTSVWKTHTYTMFKYKDEKLYMHIGGVKLSDFYMKRVDGVDADLMLVADQHASVVVKDSLLKAEFVSSQEGTWLTLTTPVTSEEVAEMKRIASEMPQYTDELHFAPSMPSPQEIDRFTIKFGEDRLSLDVGGASLKEYTGLRLISDCFRPKDLCIYQAYGLGFSVDVRDDVLQMSYFDEFTLEEVIHFETHVTKEQIMEIERGLSTMTRGFVL